MYFNLVKSGTKVIKKNLKMQIYHASTLIF